MESVQKRLYAVTITFENDRRRLTLWNWTRQSLVDPLGAELFE